ncbi:MAG: DUF493 family protein [Bacteroidota bacterium]|nr:DUF493 family protein [Bacteroidota bacterium]
MSSDKYNALRKKLDEEHQWPSLYLFKFIIPNTPKLLAQVQALFGEEAVVAYRKSKTGKYLSVSGKEVILSADEVITRYKKAESIDKIVIL